MKSITSYLFAAALALPLLVTSPAIATTLGIEDGEYIGKGVLNSESMIIPNMKYVSERSLKNGVIYAHTKAYLLGHVVAEASARLAVVGRKDQFSMIDLDTAEEAGTGRCDDTACSFTATVMDGKLTLSETWVATDSGFDVVNGYQTFDGKDASYEGSFERQ